MVIKEEYKNVALKNMRSECKIVLENFKSFKPDVEKVGELLYQMQIND